jgi:hypothetical protein
MNMKMKMDKGIDVDINMDMDVDMNTLMEVEHGHGHGNGHKYSKILISDICKDLNPISDILSDSALFSPITEGSISGSFRGYRSPMGKSKVRMFTRLTARGALTLPLLSSWRQLIADCSLPTLLLPLFCPLINYSSSVQNSHQSRDRHCSSFIL